MGRFLLAALVLVAGAWAQDTYNCPDGWMLEEDRSGCRCFMLSEGESVTRDDADILCAFHEAWVAELDHPGINYWLKSQLLAITEPGDWNQFWLSQDHWPSRRQPQQWRVALAAQERNC